MTVRIIQGDCREVLRTFDEASIDACVTDPPYHLTTGKKGGCGQASVNLNTPHGRARIGTGFMGMKWDGGDVAFRPETWAEVLRVLKPGAFLLAFSGTRTYHRMVCAIEDAGFEVRDQIGWVFGSGFPKSKNLSGEWDGWGTALKPAWEPIVLARKPLRGTVAQNVEKYSTGALNIDACRVAGEPMVPNTGRGALLRRHPTENREPGRVNQPHDLGRWPANLIHDGSEEVLDAFPDAPGQIADASNSNSSRKTQHVYGAMKRGNARDGEPNAESANAGAVGFKVRPGARRGDAGSAARFFYCAKADRVDRNEGLAGMPTRDLNWSDGPQSPGTFQSPNTNRAVENHHPTVKPTELMRYLCRLVTPPGGTVLDPFMGSGSTLKAAELEQFSAVGIELYAQYIEIARRRIGADAPLFTEVA